MYTRVHAYLVHACIRARALTPAATDEVRHDHFLVLCLLLSIAAGSPSLHRPVECKGSEIVHAPTDSFVHGHGLDRERFNLRVSSI